MGIIRNFIRLWRDSRAFSRRALLRKGVDRVESCRVNTKEGGLERDAQDNDEMIDKPGCEMNSTLRGVGSDESREGEMTVWMGILGGVERLGFGRMLVRYLKAAVLR